MTGITPTPLAGAIGAPPTAAPAAPANTLGKDAFLQLLVAQLRYQDPTNPTDSAQFMAQTAQFTQVEKLEEIAAALAQSQASQSMLAVSGMVGRTVSWIGPDGTELTDRVTAASVGPAGPLLTLTTGDQIGLGQVTAVREPSSEPL